MNLTTRFFYKQHFYKQRQKVIHILHPRYQAKAIDHILKNKQKSKSTCIHTINHNDSKYEKNIDKTLIELGVEIGTNKC